MGTFSAVAIWGASILRAVADTLARYRNSLFVLMGLTRKPAGKPLPKRTRKAYVVAEQGHNALIANVVNVFQPKPTLHADLAQAQPNDYLTSFAQTHTPIVARIDFIELGIRPVAVPSTPNKPIFEVYFAELTVR